MRFSSIFQRASESQRAAREELSPGRPARDREAERDAQLQDLPEDLDARVRLVGEWQLGEG